MNCQLKTKNLVLISKLSKEYTGFPVGLSLFIEVSMYRKREKKLFPLIFLKLSKITQLFSDYVSTDRKNIYT